MGMRAVDGEFFLGALRDDLGWGVRRDTSGKNTTVCEGTELVQKCKEVSIAAEGQGGGRGGRKNLMQTAALIYFSVEVFETAPSQVRTQCCTEWRSIILYWVKHSSPFFLSPPKFW